MSSSNGVDEEDLIDLEGGVCVSRLFQQDESLDEQEHLLDVCPPKLEQKLSLTKEQKHYRGGDGDDVDGGDVLVTLGHDQVVPNLKRIDVVSSETIKRVRVITKKLEPFIGTLSASEHVDAGGDGVASLDDKVDGTCEFFDDSDDSKEALAISAFDFLAELDDNEEKKEENEYDDAKENESQEASENPLEDKYLTDKNSHERYQDIDRCNSALDTSENDPVIKSNDFSTENQHDNLGFDLSPPNKKPRFDYHSELNKSFNIGDKLLRISGKKLMKKQNRGSKKYDRKSWSEGGSFCHSDDGNFERSTSFDNVDYPCEPSTSTGTSTIKIRKPELISGSSSECSDVDWSWVEEELEHQHSPIIPGRPTFGSLHRRRSIPSPSLTTTSSSSSSPTTTTTTTTTTINQLSKLNELSQLDSSSLSSSSETPLVSTFKNHNENSPTTTTSINNNNEVKERMRPVRQPVTFTNASIVMSVDGTGKSLSTCSTVSLGGTLDNQNYYRFNNEQLQQQQDNNNYCNDQPDIASMTTITTTLDTPSLQSEPCLNQTSSSSNSGTSWVRASMRRLRHLRLPDTSDRINNRTINTSRPVSAPNSLPDIALIAPEILAAHTNGTTGTVLRPSSAPVARNSAGIAGTPRRGRRNSNNNRNSRTPGSSARQQNCASVPDSTITGTAAVADRSTSRDNNSVQSASAGDSGSNSASVSPASRSPQHQTTTLANSPARRNCERRRDADRENERNSDEEEDDDENNPLGRWPLPLNPALACLGCTLGLFNISRFAILSVHFGANFIVQFIILSLILGIPLFTLQICLGKRLEAGAVDMWKISPIFHGVGIALLVAHAFIGIYSIIGISWMLVYFRDSFITKQDKYRWAEPFLGYRDDFKPMNNGIAYKLHETVPDYFSGVVLQRHHLNDQNPGVVTLKFQVAFNLAVVWMIVFVSLSKGLKSYGKVIYGFTLFPIILILVLCTKLLGLMPPGTIPDLFPATVWHEFFITKDSWVAASSEVFLTWGLLGAASMQIAAHNKKNHLLQRDTSLVIVLTFFVLLLAAFLANTCVQILHIHGYIYTTSSFERMSSYVFMRSVNQPVPPGQGNTPERFMRHASFLIGQRTIRPWADSGLESGYQALRLSTELIPATLAIMGTDTVSPFYAVLFYLALILFGIAQQLAIWHCVITGIMAINTKMMKLWETTITFFSCACGYILGLPMATECGIYVVYYLDYTIGGGWWIMVLYLIQIAAVFVVRGRPHTGDIVVGELFPPNSGCLRHWAGPLLSFIWNVIMPITLIILGCTLFKFGNFRDLYVYKRTRGEYWAVWARQLGAAIQLIPILLIPAVAIIQTCRYLNNGPPDIFDRIQMLYRPNLDAEGTHTTQTRYGNPSSPINGNGILPTTSDIPFEDPPPKYTPPPSYTTATGARIAKMLRQSFRRSVRRIANVLGESSSVTRTRPALQQQPPPPDYATVLVEMNQTVLPSRDVTIHTIEQQQMRPDVTDTGIMTNVINDNRHRSSTIDRITRISTIERTHSTMDRNRRYLSNGSSNLTAADVANLLRSSMRRGGGGGNTRSQQTIRNSIHNVPTSAASVENLVNAAAPIGEDSLVFYKNNSSLVREQCNDDKDNDEDKKTVSVI